LRTTRFEGAAPRAEWALICVAPCFAWLVSAEPMLAVAGASAVAVVGFAAYRPAAAAALLLGLYFIPLLAFGRVYAYIGIEPVYLPDVLLIAALALSLPLWWETYRTAVPLWYRRASAGFAVVGLFATWNGMAHGYPGALKGLVFVVYPLASGPAAAWMRVHERRWRRIVVVAALAAPVGLLILTTTDPTDVIPAAYGFYLAGLLAVAASQPPGTARRILVSAAGAGALLLVATGSRGPLLTLVVATLVGQIAWRRRSSRTVRPLVLGGAMALAVVVAAIALGGLDSSRLPIVGTAVGRATSSFASSGPEAEAGAGANVAFRLDLWQYSMDTAVHDGFLLGTGFGRPFDFRFNNVDFSTVDTGGPHNSFVGVFYYMGVPAGLAFIALIVVAFRRAGRRDASPQLATLQLTWLAAAVVTMFTNVALEGPYIGGPIWLLIGWCILNPVVEAHEQAEAEHAALHA